MKRTRRADQQLSIKVPKASVAPVALILVLATLPALMASPPAMPHTLAEAGAWLGWLGSGLVSVSLLLMVREPAIAAWFGGLDRMFRWHHTLGTFGYMALLAHPLAIAGQVLPANPAAAWRILSPFTLSWTGVLGWVALIGLMAGLASTFAIRLHYSLWRKLHAILGIGVLVGIAHLLAVRGLSASAWLVIIPAVLALGWRVLRADLGGGARPYEVSAVANLSGRITEATLKSLAAPITVMPGQFVMAAFFEGPNYRGCGEYHPYTVSGMAPDGALTLSIKALGDCTRNIQSLEPGVAVRVQGPYGTFLVDRIEAPELWVAGGIGITPFLALLRAGPVIHPTDLVYVYRETADAPHLAELTGYSASQALLRFHPLALQENPTPLFELLETLPDMAERQVYLCGPPSLVDAITRQLRLQGIAQRQIHFESFDFR